MELTASYDAWNDAVCEELKYPLCNVETCDDYPYLYNEGVTCKYAATSLWDNPSLGAYITVEECAALAEANPLCTGNVISHAGWYTSNANWQCFCCESGA